MGFTTSDLEDVITGTGTESTRVLTIIMFPDQSRRYFMHHNHNNCVGGVQLGFSTEVYTGGMVG